MKLYNVTIIGVRIEGRAKVMATHSAEAITMAKAEIHSQVENFVDYKIDPDRLFKGAKIEYTETDVPTIIKCDWDLPR